MEHCEHDQFAVIGAILGFLATCLVGVFILGASPEVSFLDLAQAAGPLIIAIGAVVAFMNYRQAAHKARRDAEIRKSKSYLDEAINTLERSFELLMNGKNSPPNDRLSWLSTARTLLSYEEIKALVFEDDHRIILGEREEYWKKKFFDALHGKMTGFEMEYFRGDAKYALMAAGTGATGISIKPTPLDYRSVAVVYGFCNWPNSKPDQMDKVDAVTRFFEDKTVLHANHGMRQWLEADYPTVWQAYQKS